MFGHFTTLCMKGLIDLKTSIKGAQVFKIDNVT